MSTTTPKLGLIKPDGGDYVDVNDLNTNFDKIDNMTATDVGARPSTWMPSASDVGARVNYNTLAEIGLTNQTVSIEKIVNNMATNSMLVTAISSSTTPSGTFPPGSGLLVVYKQSVNFVQFYWQAFVTSVAQSGAGSLYNGYYNSAASPDKWTGWREVAFAENFLPLNGGTLTGNVLLDRGASYGNVSISRTISNVVGKLEMGVLSKDNKPLGQVVIFRDDVRSGGIVIGDTSAGEPALRYRKADDTYTEFFGEHNKPSGIYTGTGSGRNVDVGAFASNTNTILITRSDNAYWGMVNENGCMYVYNNGYYLYSSSSVYFDTEAKQLKFSSSVLNVSGYEYRWTVL